MAEIILRNESSNEFTDISSEQCRTYGFSNCLVTINEPQYLSVSKSGGHRVLDKNGVCHYIPSGWIHLAWKVYDDKPHFVK